MLTVEVSIFLLESNFINLSALCIGRNLYKFVYKHEALSGIILLLELK
jgi:hypothetical protein